MDNKLEEKIEKEMPEFQGDEMEKKIKKILYIYLEVAKNKMYNPEYFFGNSETRKKIIEVEKRGYVKSTKDGKKRVITCVSTSQELAVFVK